MTDDREATPVETGNIEVKTKVGRRAL